MQKISLVLPLINHKDPLSTKNALLNYLNTYTLDSWSNLDKANFYTLIAKYCRFANAYSEALYYFNLAKQHFDITDIEGEINYVGDYYYYFSFLEIDLGNLAHAKDLAILCFNFYNKNNDKNGIGKAYDLISQVNLKYLDFDEAIDYALKSITILEAIKGKIDTSYNNLGEIYRFKGDLHLALEYYQKAFEKAYENDDIYTMAIVYNNFGLIYSELGEYDIALQNFSNSYLNFKKLDILDFECTIDYASTFISVYSILNLKRDEILSNIENLIVELRAHIFETESNTYLFNFLALLGQFESKRNNYFKAEQYFNASLDLIDYLDNPLLRIIIRVHFINWALKLYNIEQQNYYLEKAKLYLEEAKKISYETLHSTLLAELKILEAGIIAVKDKPEASFILGGIMNFAKNANNLRLIAKIELEKARIQEKNNVHKTHADILQYINSIARLTNIPQ